MSFADVGTVATLMDLLARLWAQSREVPFMRQRIIFVFAAVSLMFLSACGGASDDSPDTTTVTLSAESAEVLGGSEGDEIEVTAAPEHVETVEADPTAELEGDLATLTDDVLESLGEDPSAMAADFTQEYRAVTDRNGVFEFEIPAQWSTLDARNKGLAGVADPNDARSNLQNYILVSPESKDPSKSYFDNWNSKCRNSSAQIKPYSVDHVTGFSRIYTECPGGGTLILMIVQLSTGDQPNFLIDASVNSPENLMALAHAIGTLKSLK